MEKDKIISYKLRIPNFCQDGTFCMALFVPKSTKHRGYTDFCQKIGSGDANLIGILGKIRRNLLKKQPKLPLTQPKNP